METFRDDLEYGRVAEVACKDYLLRRGYDIVEDAPKEYFPDYDVRFYTGGNWYNVEVKRDRKAKFTGNIAIEVFNSCSNSSSGLSATSAHYYYISTDDADYVLRTGELRAYIDSRFNDDPRSYVLGGDGGCSAIVLLKIADIEGLAIDKVYKG